MSRLFLRFGSGPNFYVDGADPDTNFHFDADPDPHQRDANLQHWPNRQGSRASLRGSIVSLFAGMWIRIRNTAVFVCVVGGWGGGGAP